MFLQFLEGMMTLLLIMMCWVFLLSNSWMFYQPFLRNSPKCYIFTPFLPQHTGKTDLKLVICYSKSHVITCGVFLWEESGMFCSNLVRNCLINLFSLSQQREALSFSPNTLCRWLTVGDSTLCAGLTTDSTMLSCSKVDHSWRSSLQNLHFVNICHNDANDTDDTNDYNRVIGIAQLKSFSSAKIPCATRKTFGTRSFIVAGQHYGIDYQIN